MVIVLAAMAVDVGMTSCGLHRDMPLVTCFTTRHLFAYFL